MIPLVSQCSKVFIRGGGPFVRDFRGSGVIMIVFRLMAFGFRKPSFQWGLMSGAPYRGTSGLCSSPGFDDVESEEER